MCIKFNKPDRATLSRCLGFLMRCFYAIYAGKPAIHAVYAIYAIYAEQLFLRDLAACGKPAPRRPLFLCCLRCWAGAVVRVVAVGMYVGVWTMDFAEKNTHKS
jgi:hypothetical protein